MDVDGTHTAQCVGLRILVQQFIGIQFRAVGRQEENGLLVANEVNFKLRRDAAIS